MEFNEIEYTVPEWSLGYLINGDASGLSDDDYQSLQALEQDLPGSGHWAVDDSESYFSHSNDVHNLGDNVVDAKWLYRD